MKLISGIDMPCPHVGKAYHFEAEWTQHTQPDLWPHDFLLAKSCGLDWLRYGWPWALVEPRPGEFDWRELDTRMEYASKIDLEICLTLTQFSFPDWLVGPNGEHAALAPQLSERVAFLAENILVRYRPKLVIPLVEMAMDSFQRALAGNWQPHLRNNKYIYEAMWANLCKSFRTAAPVIRSYGARVLCCEPVTEIKKLIPLREFIDVAGIDYYPHFHGRVPLVFYLKQAYKLLGVPVALTEFGVPESYDEATLSADESLPIAAGQDINRTRIATRLISDLCAAKNSGVPVEAAGWFPLLDNFWTMGLTEQPPGDGDRAGLIDFVRDKNGRLQRVPCENLIEALCAIRDI